MRTALKKTKRTYKNKHLIPRLRQVPGVNQHFMRVFLLLILLCSGRPSSGQSLADQKNVIDDMVANIDSDTSQKLYSFSMPSSGKVLLPIKYIYWTKNKKITKIERQFKIRNDRTEQSFYFKNDQLIYSTESITTYYFEKNTTDSMGWGGNYYFSKGKLIDLRTFGHGKSETDDWDPQAEVLLNCKNGKLDIRRTWLRKTAVNTR